MKKSFEEITETWHSSGLLEGFSESRKIIVAICLERTTEYLLNRNTYDEFYILTFLAIRRIFNERKISLYNFSISHFVKTTQFEFEKFNNKFPDDYFYSVLEKEATFCSEFAESYKNDSKLLMEII